MGSIAFLFPGQGSQHVGMGQALYQVEPTARAVFELADQLLGFSLTRLCFEGPAEELTDTINAQPAIYVASLAVAHVVAERTGLKPSYVAGHSLGEFSALAASGALSFQDGLRLVRERGRLMKQAGQNRPGGMAAILGLESSTVIKACSQAESETGQPVRVANDNCPGQTVISGADAGLERAMTLASELGARRVVRLEVSIAAHSPLMVEAAAGFAQPVSQLAMRPPEVPVVGNTTASPLADAAAIRSEMVAQLTHTVRWTESMQYLLSRGVSTFVEIGPKDVLTGLMKRIDRSVTCLSVQEPADVTMLRDG